MENKKLNIGFAAIDPYIQSNIVTPKESKMYGKDYIIWGDGNLYPQYLESLAQDSPTFRAIVQGATDIAVGDDVTLWDGRKYINESQTIRDLARLTMRDLIVYRGFAWQVMRSVDGEISIYHLPMAYIRTDKDNEQFWYSEEWQKNGGRVKTIRYDRFVPEFNQSDAVLFYKGDVYTTYPQPQIAAAVKACETEARIDDFHLNELENGFMGSYVVNFNNGQPTDEIREEIEKNFNEKFAGTSNAGRIMFSFNDNKENAVTLQKMEIADYGEKYETLAKHCRQQIFTAYRANPNLFGIPTESLGFSSEEYESAFKLFNRTFIQPLQQAFCDALDKVLGVEGTTTIVPFSLDGASKTIE